MALVKSSRISAGETKGQAIADGPVAAEAAVRRPKERGPSGTRHAKASERVAAATEQLTSGLSEAAAAAEELRRSMEQIAAGSEEAASASQEQLEAIRSVLADFDTARGEAESSRRRTEGAQIVLTETAVQITASVRAIEKNAERQFKSVAIIAELERRAQDIGEIIQTVSRIADQTNLLALNAAIEAARAGDHGRGFAVVAEEVRALAETSEKSAQDVQGFAEAIQARVREVVEAVRSAAERAAAEAKTGIAAVDGLGALRRDMSGIAEGSQNTALAAAEAERAASEGLRGAEQVATAAEEQSAAANEAQTAIQQQAQSLDQGQIAAQSMAALADELRGGRTEAAEQIGVAAEQLSASVQELSSAASQIMVAVAQINRGSQLQAAAAQQTSAALTQIESSAAVARSNAEAANAQAEAMAAGLRENRTRIEGLVTGVENALRDTAASLELILGIETVGRRIDKAVDTIVLVAVQTSMLAVSGAVEAARTGDSGRGFAVVSHDIRNLAREASDSADRVKDTVRGIIDQVASVRRYLEQIITLADAEVERNRPLFDTLAKVDGEVAALGIANAAIVQRADAIRAAVGQTAAGARQIATAAAQASAASRQAATASSEQARGAEDLAAAIEEIASLADELKQPNG